MMLLERLMDLAQTDAFEREFASMLNNFGLCEKPFCLTSNVSSFKLKNGHYEMSMDVDDNTNADNVEINLSKKNVLSIKYQMKTKTSEQIVSIKETLPSDADADTLDASIKDGKLIVTVEQSQKNTTKVAINK